MKLTYLQFPEGINAMIVDDNVKGHTITHGTIQISGQTFYPGSKIIIKTMKISYPRWKNRYGS